MPTRARCLSCLVIACLAVAATGCGQTGTPKPPAPVTKAPNAGAASAANPASGTIAAPSAAGNAQAAPGAASGAPGQTYKTSGPQDDPTAIEVGGLTMRKPTSWVWTAPTMQFRALQYAVPAIGSDAPAAELVFSVFGSGDGGPVDANLDRWAGQFRSEDGTGAAPSKRTQATVNGMTVARVESKGAYMGMGQAAPRPGQMQLGAILQAPGRNIFIKLVGPEATVESNRAAFDAMLESAK